MIIYDVFTLKYIFVTISVIFRTIHLPAKNSGKDPVICCTSVQLDVTVRKGKEGY